MGNKNDSVASGTGYAVVATGIAAGCAGIDTAVAYGIASIAKVAMPSKLMISGVTFGVSFAFAFFAMCLCKAASDADDYMDELNERRLA